MLQKPSEKLNLKKHGIGRRLFGLVLSSVRTFPCRIRKAKECLSAGTGRIILMNRTLRTMV